MAQLPCGLMLVVESLIAPLTMLWLTVCWFFLDSIQKFPEGQTDDQKKTLQTKAERATHRGFAVGLLLAVAVVASFYELHVLPVAQGIATGQAIRAAGIGAAAGVGVRFIRRYQDWMLMKSWSWGLAVAAGSGFGLTALILTYASGWDSFVRLWLTGCFLCLIIAYRIAFLFGD
jgi:hypothetical protein